MTNKIKHTPTPWQVAKVSKIDDKKGTRIATCGSDGSGVDGVLSREANAAFIVKCVNAHEKLVEIVKDFLSIGILKQTDLYDDKIIKAQALLTELEQLT